MLHRLQDWDMLATTQRVQLLLQACVVVLCWQWTKPMKFCSTSRPERETRTMIGSHRYEIEMLAVDNHSLPMYDLSRFTEVEIDNMHTTPTLISFRFTPLLAEEGPMKFCSIGGPEHENQNNDRFTSLRNQNVCCINVSVICAMQS